MRDVVLGSANAVARPFLAGVPRVLVVDDDPEMRTFLVRLLGKRWPVEAVADGPAALAAIRAHRPALVITDVMMPGLDGFALLRELRRDPSTRAIPIIMISARAGESEREGLEAGADDYLVKPFSPRELMARVTTRLELQRLGSSLQHERAAVAALFAQTPIPVAIFRGPELVYEDLNSAYMDALGVGDVRGRRLSDVLPTLAGAVSEVLREVMRTGVAFIGRAAPVKLERNAVIEDTYWDVTCASLMGPGAECVIVICSEVTDQVFAHKRLEELVARADAANRTKDEFLALLGHELRNPLAPIVTSLQLMRLANIHTPEQDVIERQVSYLTRLVDDLLDVSRITRGKIELRKHHIELGVVIDRAIETTRPLLELRHHRVVLVLARNGLAIHADPDRMVQVFANLLTNAAKYSEPGSVIEVRAQRVGCHVFARVIDEGVGIEPAMLERVFEVFTQRPQTLARADGGLGIGLSIVRSLVEMHGGSVSARSEGVGKGSEFAIALPAARMAIGSPAASPKRRPGSRGTQRILVVDDNGDAALGLKKALEQLGYTVAVAHDGPAALRVAMAFEPDVALLDIGLPGMSGYELSRRLRELRQLRLIAVTGYGQESDRERSLAAGFDDHLVKPVDLDQLDRILELLK